MLFTSSIWLIGLLPWTAVAVLLLVSRRPRTEVPFLELWRLNAPQESIRRSFSTPPLGVILALLATLFAILAAAGPAVRQLGPSALTIVLDVGSSMSAQSADAPKQTRYEEAAQRLAGMLRDENAADLPIELLVIPGSPGRSSAPSRLALSALPATVAAIAPSALDTRAEVRRIVGQRLMDPAARVLLISDHPGDFTEAPTRIAKITPLSPPIRNLGIRHLAVRRTPTSQAMVRIERIGLETPQPLTLRVTTTGETANHRIGIVAEGEKSLFIPLRAVGSVVTAELINATGVAVVDGFAADNRLDAIAESDWPILQPEISVGELQRLMDVYSASRPHGEQSVKVRLTPSAAALSTSPGVIMPALTTIPELTQVKRAADHLIVADVDLSKVTLPASINRTLPPGPWQALLWDNAGPLLAVREVSSPASEAVVRQAWCVIDPRGWAQHVEYVVFWSALFDWIGGINNDAASADRMATWPLDRLTPEWTPIERTAGGDGAFYWPGVYERQGDGRRRAFGPAATPAGGAVMPAPEQVEQLRAVLRQGERHVLLSPWLLLAALLLAGGAAFIWKRSTRLE